ncbi:MAG: ABC transporter ATP-binding protein [Stappiaceae bacterium]
MATVELKNLAKRFGDFTALKGLDLSIDDGEFLVLLGPSGCGKSTTMRLIAGLEEPTSGDILIDDRKVNDIPARERDLAMVFQNYALYPHMTVDQNIGYPLKIQKIPSVKRAERVRDAAAKVEMDHLLARKPGELSGGQRQRVALARAIVRTPKLFLMDEPLSNLDAKLRTLMRAELKHLQKDLGTTTIYVTHDQVEAMTLADRIVILNDAVIQQVGAPAEIYARPANTFVAGFIGSPPMNLLGGAFENEHFTFAGGSVPMKGAGKATLGVRPEDITIADEGDADLTGVVYSSELLGDCVLLYVRAGEELIAAKVAPDQEMPIDTAVSLRFSPSKLHLFDGGSGTRKEMPE